MDPETDTVDILPVNPEYEDETKRLMTFTNPLSPWPTHLSQKPADLAHAGFVYEGNDDEVFCFWCDGTLSCWEEEDIPLVEHAKIFPECEYIKQINIEKIVGGEASPSRTSEDPNLTSTEQDTDTASTSPNHPEYKDETKRLKTFTKYPLSVWPRNKFKNPLEWAHAGFVYTGTLMYCFWCDCHVLTWDDEDVPLVKHARLSPECEYIQKIYISKIQGDYYRRRNKDKQGERQDEATDDIDLFLFPHVLECLQSGYTREEIQAVFDEYGRKNSQELTPLSPRSHPRHVVGEKDSTKQDKERHRKRQPGEQPFPIRSIRKPPVGRVGHEVLDSRLSLMMAIDFQKQPKDEQLTESKTENSKPLDDSVQSSRVASGNAEFLLSKEVPEQLQDSLINLRLKATCILCNELYSRPRALANCTHVFCHECINQYLIKKQSSNFPPCPICNKPIQLVRTKEDRDSATVKRGYSLEPKLKVALAENDIVDFIKAFEYCQICQKRERPTLKCVECGTLICEMCKSSHQSHTFAPVLGLSVVCRGQYLEECKVHKNQSLDLYCLMCGTAICIYCEKYSHAECTKKYDNMQNFITKVARTSSRLFEQFHRSSQERNKLLDPLIRRYKDIYKESQEIPPMVLRVVRLKDFSSFSRQYLEEMKKEVENDIMFYKEYIDKLDSLIEKQSSTEQLLFERKESLQNAINVLCRNGETLVNRIVKLVEKASDIEIAEAALIDEKTCIYYFRNRQFYSLISRPLKLQLENFTESKVILRQTSMADIKKLDEILCFVFVATVEITDTNAARNQATTIHSYNKQLDFDQTLLTAIKCFTVFGFYKIIYCTRPIPDNSLYINRFADHEEKRNVRLQMACSLPIAEGFIGDEFRNVIEHRCIVSCRFDDKADCIYVLLKAKTTSKTFYYRTDFASLLSALPLALRNDCIYRLDKETPCPDLICLIGPCNKKLGLEMLFLEFEQENGFTNGIAVDAKAVQLKKATFPSFQIEMKFSFLEDRNKGFSFVKAKPRQRKALIRYYSRVENSVSPEQFLVTLADGLESPVPIHRVTVDLLCETTKGMYFVKCMEDTQEIIIGRLTMSRVIKKEDTIWSLSQDNIRVELGKLVPLTMTETRNNDLVVVCAVENGNFFMIFPLRQTTEILEIQYPLKEPFFNYSGARILDFEMDCDGNIMYVLKDVQGEVMRIIAKYILPSDK